jgi:hypothetical protein
VKPQIEWTPDLATRCRPYGKANEGAGPLVAILILTGRDESSMKAPGTRGVERNPEVHMWASCVDTGAGPPTILTLPNETWMNPRAIRAPRPNYTWLQRAGRRAHPLYIRR